VCGGGDVVLDVEGAVKLLPQATLKLRIRDQAIYLATYCIYHYPNPLNICLTEAAVDGSE
jgi:hypothetical protein